MSQTANQTIPASQRWAKIREAAGYPSDRALEQAARLSIGTLWSWTTPGKRGRNPNVRRLRIIRDLLHVTLDELDEILTSWREELARADVR